MKKTHFILVVVLLATAFVLTDCKKACGCLTLILTLKEKVQAKTYRVLSVTKGNADVTQDFQDVKISFDANGFTFQYITATTHSSNCDIQTTSIILNTPPTRWGNALTEVKTDEQGNTFEFVAFITDPVMGGANYLFKMQKF